MSQHLNDIKKLITKGIKLVYKATCKICDDSYIVPTQQKLKDWMGQHLNDIKRLITKGIN
jgi:hypothetical protein